MIVIKVVLTILALAAILYIVLTAIKKYHPGYVKSHNFLLDETIFLDSTSKIVSVKHEKQKFIILLGKNTDLLLHKEEIIKHVAEDTTQGILKNRF